LFAYPKQLSFFSPQTLEYAKELETILGAPGGDAFGRMFKRVLEGGGWEQAKSSVGKEGVEKPWLVRERASV